MRAILSIKNLNKIYTNKVQALKDVSLDVRQGEIFALLGPNGAGKTTLIGAICGLVSPSDGQILVNGHDINENFRLTRRLIGLVPQELCVETFEPVWDTVNFSRGLFGLAPDRGRIEEVLKKLTLWDKRKHRIMTLSGGMKRRVMIAKALAHEPQLLFLDEPTAGVDVELRKDMWRQVKALKQMGVTIILTTHYIDEAEEMADRIGVMNQGQIILTESKQALMQRFGHKQLLLDLSRPLEEIPASLSPWSLELDARAHQLRYTFDALMQDKGVASLLSALAGAGIHYTDMHIKQSSLEEIFIELVKRP